MCYNKLIRFLIHRKELFMAVCYKKLWKLLIDKNMNKTELRMASGITTTALAKLGRDENVNTEVLAKICQTLDCKIEDIMELVPEGEEK
jgi:DNA-binding Xre family transcriptional regulator